jgi:hypothetical protein
MKEYDDTTSGTIHSRAIRKGLSVLYSAVCTLAILNGINSLTLLICI